MGRDGRKLSFGVNLEITYLGRDGRQISMVEKLFAPVIT